MRPIRVLVVDDAVVIRRLVTEALSAYPGLEVVGVAANGQIALAKLPQVNPDIVILDVEMPEMDGLQTLAALRKSYPRLPVIMFSTLTQRGGTATLDALALGANDYVTKPMNAGSTQLALERVRDELVPRIISLCEPAPHRAGSPGAPRPPLPPPHTASAMREAPSGRIDAVAIGVSTGGPNALAALLPTLPAEFPVPVLIVQHMPPLFTRLLAERLDSKCALSVREAAQGDVVSKGGVWIAPGDYHLSVGRDQATVRTQLDQGPTENSCRPAVDVLLRSVVEVWGGAVLAVVLTGMGQDGLRGCASVRDAGGEVVAQDESSSVVWGMPGAVANAGLADAVLPLDQLGAEILQRVGARRAALAGSRG